MELFAFDDSYVQRLRSGERATESHFVSYFSELLGIKLRARRLPLDVVQDLKQETFARVLKTLRSEGGLRQPERLGAFVNSVCTNVLLEFYRSNSRYEAQGEAAPEIPDKVMDLQGLLITEETRQFARETLAQIPSKDARLLRAVFFEERPKDSICKEFGVDANYLRVLVFRAKERFKVKFLESQALSQQRLMARRSG